MQSKYNTLFGPHLILLAGHRATYIQGLCCIYPYYGNKLYKVGPLQLSSPSTYNANTNFYKLLMVYYNIITRIGIPMRRLQTLGCDRLLDLRQPRAGLDGLVEGVHGAQLRRLLGLHGSHLDPMITVTTVFCSSFCLINYTISRNFT